MLKHSHGLAEPWVGRVSLSSSFHVFLSWLFVQFSFISPHSLAQITYNHADLFSGSFCPGPLWSAPILQSSPASEDYFSDNKVGIVTAGTLPLLTEEGIKSGQKESHSMPLLCCALEKEYLQQTSGCSSLVQGNSSSAVVLYHLPFLPFPVASPWPPCKVRSLFPFL